MIRYRDFIITYAPPPIPHRHMDWSYAHIDYDGAPSGDLRDSRDTRYGYCGSMTECLNEIDGWYVDQGWAVEATRQRA